MPDRCRHQADPDTCETCYAEDLRRMSLPRQTLSEDLADLEATNPRVAATVERLDQERDRQLRKMRRQDALKPCPFCAIVAGTAPATIVRSWPDAIAIVPLNPVVEGHLLVIPRAHVEDFRDDPVVSGAVMARAAGLARSGLWPDLNVIASAGPAATQTIRHLHLHLVPRHEGDGLALPWTG